MSSHDPSPDHSPASEPGPTPVGGSAKPHVAPGSFDASSVERSDWIVLGLALALFVCGFLPWYTVSVDDLGLGPMDGYSVSGWNGWWTLIQLLVLAVLALKAVEVFAKQSLPVPPIALPAAGAAIVVLTLIALIQALTDGIGGNGLDAGPGFGLWLALPLSVALTYFLAVDAQKKGATLPVRVPGASA